MSGSDDEQPRAGAPGDAEWGALGEGEEVLFEGGARGRPPLAPFLPVYVMVFLFPYLLGAFMLFMAWRSAPVPPTWDVGARLIRLRWEQDGSSASTSAAGPLWGPIDADLPGAGKVEVPWLLVVLAGAAGVEVLRHRAALTNRRVLLASGVVRRRLAVHGRTGQEALHTVSPLEDALAGLEGGVAVTLRGLDPADRVSLERALARFEPGPTPAPPDPRLRRRALLAVVLLGLLGAAVGLWIAAAPGRVTLVARRAGAPGEELIHLTVDSPTWGGLRVTPWDEGRPMGRGSGGSMGQSLENGSSVGRRLERAPVTFTRVELDGAPWQPGFYRGAVDVDWDSGLFRVQLTMALEERGALIAAERVVVAGVLHTVDGRELPFEASLPSPGTVTLELEPR